MTHEDNVTRGLVDRALSCDQKSNGARNRLHVYCLEGHLELDWNFPRPIRASSAAKTAGPYVWP